MKAWGDQPPRRRPRSARLLPSLGSGLARLDGTVLVPGLAVLGREVFELSVLEDPATGDWWGEDPDFPGSGLVAIDPAGAIPASPEAREALGAAATVARQVRVGLARSMTSGTLARHRGAARAIAAGLPRPAPDGLAIDLGRAASGRIPEPARWWRMQGEVRLETPRSDDDPLCWAEEWRSAEDLLVADGPEARTASANLAAAVRADRAERAAHVDETVRDAALRHLASIAPGLVASLDLPTGRADDATASRRRTGSTGG